MLKTGRKIALLSSSKLKKYTNIANLIIWLLIIKERHKFILCFLLPVCSFITKSHWLVNIHTYKFASYRRKDISLNRIIKMCGNLKFLLLFLQLWHFAMPNKTRKLYELNLSTTLCFINSDIYFYSRHPAWFKQDSSS